MNEIKQLVYRNIKVFLRDRTAVFFSFLSVLIMLVLYLLFLGKLYTNDLVFASESTKTILSIGQMMGGILIINSMSLSLGMMGNIITDLELHLLEGFLVTPVKRYKIILSYFISALIVTFILNFIMLVVTLLYAGISSGHWYDFMTFIKATSVIVLSTFISSSIMILITSILKSNNAFGTVSGVLGTLIGFIAGIYMPLANFGVGMTYISSLFPFTHLAILMKNILLEMPYALLESELSGIANGNEIMLDVQKIYGTNEIGILGEKVHLVFIFILFIVLSIVCLYLSFRKMTRRISNI